MAKTCVSIGVYIIEWGIAFLFFSNIFEFKYSKIRTAVFGFLMYMTAAAEYVFFYNPIFNSVFVLLINIFYVNLFFKTSRIKGLISAVTYSALLNLSEWITIQSLSFATGAQFEQIVSVLSMFVLGSTMSKTLQLVLSIFTAKIVFRQSSSSPDNHTPAFLFILPISVLIVDFSFWELSVQNEPSPINKVFIIVGSTVMLVSVLLTYVFYGNALRHSQELFQLQHEYEKVQVDKEYYNILDHQNEVLRTFIHDEKSHLTALQCFSTLDEVHTYVNHVLGDLQCVVPLGTTQNKMLDLILSKYSSLCKIKGIVFSYSTFTANLSFMDDTDLVSLMSNIMDNAVEAAETAEKGRINLALEKKAIGLTILTCENTSGHAPIVQNGNLKTSKANKSRHGVGIKSIVRTAKKYDGSFDWTWDDHANLFTVTIAFER